MTARPTQCHRRRRVAFYSHDTQGLGHTRRNILIAGALVDAHPGTDVLLLTGSPEATALPLPPHTEVLTLPTLHKDGDGHYSPRVLSSSLDDVLHMRSRLIETALSAFQPDLFVVDKVARGVRGSLDRALISLRRAGGTRTVLGLRDVLDEPRAARREWETTRATEAVRDLYDEVWVYGDRRVYDPVREYALPRAVAEKVVFTGYLAGPRPPCLQIRYLSYDGALPPRHPFVLCLVGGGQDGYELARSFLHAQIPAGRRGIVLTGPYMPIEQRRELMDAATLRGDVEVHEFVSGAYEFVRQADAAVSMGGYNSVCELLSAGCPTLLVPRVRPRLEQALRAARLAYTGLVDVLPQDEATPGAMSRWLAWTTGAAVHPRPAVDLDGLTRIPALVERLVGQRRAGPRSA